MDEGYPEPGQTLKSLRTERAWSLSEAALRTGVSKAMLGQIERGESSPTVATLWKIATGFNAPFSLFISGIGPCAPPATVLRSEKLPLWQQRSATMQAASLFPYDKTLGLDMLTVELAPGGISESAAHERGVIEHVVVTEGALMLNVDDHGYRLVAGEALRFAADRPHRYHNQTQARVRFYSLIHYPLRLDRPE